MESHQYFADHTLHCSWQLEFLAAQKYEGVVIRDRQVNIKVDVGPWIYQFTKYLLEFMIQSVFVIILSEFYMHRLVHYKVKNTHYLSSAYQNYYIVMNPIDYIVRVSDLKIVIWN